MSKQFEHMQKLAFGKKLINESTEKMTKSSFKQKIKEMILNEMNEAKKKKSEDVAPQEDIDINVNDETPIDVPTDIIAPEVGNVADINPTVKSIQDSLQKAYAQAKQLGDAKLATQIGNTITMLVRDQVLGGGQQAVAEGEHSADNLKDLESELNKLYQDSALGIGNAHDHEGAGGSIDYLIKKIADIKKQQAQ